MPMPPPCAVLFDLDDTLLDRNSFAQSIVHTCEQLADAVPELDAARIAEANAAAFADYWSEISAKWVWQSPIPGCLPTPLAG